MGQATAARLVTAHEILGEFQDISYRSVSFDLHGTLVLPRSGWNQRIYNGFKSVFIENGFTETISDMEEEFGIDGTIDFVARNAKKWYRKADKLLETMEEHFKDPKFRWSIVNTYFLVELITGSTDGIGIGYVRQKLAQNFPNDDPGGRLSRMGVTIHERISGSQPQDWYTIPEQTEVVAKAQERGLIISVLSNGSGSSVTECVKHFFPTIPPWQVFTPETLYRTGKPAPSNPALVLFNLGCAMVRNAMEGRPCPPALLLSLPKKPIPLLREEWRKARSTTRKKLCEQIERDPSDAFSLLGRALVAFCKQLKIPEHLAETILIQPHEHLHIGNSEYHDRLPMVGLSLPMRCLLYAPQDPNS